MVNRGKWIDKESDYLERLKYEILMSFYINPISGCYEWSKSFQRNGYGQKRAFGKMMPAHRASWIAFNGTIPSNVDVAHCCGNKSCVNPAHLKLLSHADNMKERLIFGNSGKKKVTLNGIEYPSIADAARSIGVERATVRYHLKKGK